MKLDRTRTKLKKMDREQDSYMDASPAERVSFMWELTVELWSIKDKFYAQQRLQRDVANLVRRQG